MKWITSSLCFMLFITSIGAKASPRILGGQIADIRDFPYQVSFRVQNDYICSGCIISEKHVLTVAHCFTNTKNVRWPYFDVSIHTGTNSIVERGNVHRIAKVWLHPGWVPIRKILNNDVAVVKIEGSIRFDATQQMIDLASRNVVSHSHGKITGWGRTQVNNPANPAELQWLQENLLTHTDCQPLHKDTLYKEQLCALHSRGHGACIGDSGAPLVVQKEVVGVLSYMATGSCGTGAVEIYSNVFAQKNFIQHAMSLN